MPPNYIALLNWAVVAVSFFNTIALLWLGMTVLLNAERRRWGTWAAGGALAASGLFFAGHTTLIARDLLALGWEAELWTRVVWLPFVGAPYFWYLVMAWYTGVLAAGRHRVWLAAVTLLGALALALPVVANPLPSYDQLRGPSPPIYSVGGVPVFLMVYPVYSLLCIILAITALWRPGASDRFMGDLARGRARPWLLAASLVLLLVGLAVGAAATWFLVGLQTGTLNVYAFRTLVVLHGFDLLVSGLIAVLTVLMGKAIVSYEVFTGKSLPRGGLLRYWRNSLMLAAGYGALMGWSLDLPVDPIYRLLLATVLMTLFYALLSWRSYAERERSMERLRPFVASQRLYDRMLRPVAPPALDIDAPFRALCGELLDARAAYLVPLGPLAPLVEPLAYAAHGAAGPPPPLGRLAEQLSDPQIMCVPVDPREYGEAVWGVPLWSERGLIGVLLLGEKAGGGLYTQEEIEIARAAGERLIDARASAELARRLMAIQRQRLAESQVIDRQARRVLHDDVLPQLHAAMLMLQAGDNGRRSERDAAPAAAENGRPPSDAIALLADAHRQIANLLYEMPATAGTDVARLGLLGALRSAVGGELGGAFDRVSWQIEPSAERALQNLSPLTAEVLFYAAREAIRNAARYGRGGDTARPLTLSVAAGPPGLTLTIEDDGVGISAAAIPSGGVGRGLALHATMLAVVGGTLTTESAAGSFTRVRLALPDPEPAPGALSAPAADGREVL